MGQASTCAKLHRTNRDNRNDFSRSPTHVRRIGQGASKPSDITGRLCPFGDSVKLVSRLAHPTARLRMVPIEFVVCQLAASVSDRIPRVKTCNCPLLLSCSALDMHRTLLGRPSWEKARSCATLGPDFRIFVQGGCNSANGMDIGTHPQELRTLFKDLI